MSTDDGVLVLDSNGQCAMSVIRSLGRRGVSVTAGGTSRWSLGMHSRYSDGAYVHPDPELDRADFYRHLYRHLDRSEYTAVVPITDRTSLLLAQQKAELERTGTLVACEDRELFTRVYDKTRLFEMLVPLAVPTPETYAPKSMAELSELAEDIEYPVVVKPRSKTHLVDNTVETTLVGTENYADSPAELRRTYRQFVRRYDHLERHTPLVQEYIPGTTTTTVVLADQGSIVRYFQEERLRTYPSSGGNSALLAAVQEPRMLEYTERVLDRLGWTGPAMVEFMRTPGGEFYVIEVNGRYWGSLPFAIECGVDFPWDHYCQLRGSGRPAATDGQQYRTDLVQRRLFYEDINWLVENVAMGNLGAVGPFLRAFGESRHTFVAADDPVPTVGALVQAAVVGYRAGRSAGGDLVQRGVGALSEPWRTPDR